jgi:3-oxoacyl-[acyl-carrier-protein] synthase-1
MVDRSGKPMRVALAPWLDPAYSGQERFEALLCPAIEQALVTDPVARGFRVALALALPEARPGLPPDLEADLESSIPMRFPHSFTAVAVFAKGHASGLLALRAACQRIDDGAFDACVVAGVESYLAPETLEWVDDCGRLHGSGTPGNPWGFVPGEGAGAALLTSARFVEQLRIEPLARVLSIGIAFEENRANQGRVCIGDGLSAAFRASLEALPRHLKVTDVFCDMNGEPDRADEFGFASLRTKPAFVSQSDFVAAASCWGDVSAASAPLGVMLSAIAHRKGYSNGHHALVWASSDGGERAAALLELQ